MKHLALQSPVVPSATVDDSVEYSLVGVSKTTLERARRNMDGAKAAYARVHAACMTSTPVVTKRPAPTHLLAAFK